MANDCNYTILIKINGERDAFQYLDSRLRWVNELYVAHFEDSFYFTIDLITATVVDPRLIAHQLENLVRGSEETCKVSHDPSHDFKVEDQLLHEEQV